MKTNVLIFFGLAKVLLFWVKMKYPSLFEPRHEGHLSPVTTGDNLTYLAHSLPGQSFNGAKLFIGTPEMQRIFVVKDKLFCSMKKCMVSMATINIILEHGGTHAKLDISPLLLILEH